MSASLKLISLNIEKDRHLDRIVPFLSERMPDVFCAQEVYESSIPTLVKALGSVDYVYVPMTGRPKENPPQMQGIAIFSRLPILKRQVKYYVGTPDQVPDSFQGDPLTYNASTRMILACDVEKEGEMFRIATTHFTWTPDGSASDDQRRDMRALLSILDGMGDFVLAGDFNAPRGGEMFAQLSNRYKDNIPLEYTTSLDPNLHRAGPLQLMVDGLFSTSGHVVSEVEMISGVSDHKALVANVSKAD